MFVLYINVADIVWLQFMVQYVCSAQYGCFVHLLDFVLSRYVTQVYYK